MILQICPHSTSIITSTTFRQTSYIGLTQPCPQSQPGLRTLPAQLDLDLQSEHISTWFSTWSLNLDLNLVPQLGPRPQHRPQLRPQLGSQVSTHDSNYDQVPNHFIPFHYSLQANKKANLFDLSDLVVLLHWKMLNL